MPWVEAMFDVPWNLIVIQCKVCSKIEKEKWARIEGCGSQMCPCQKMKQHMYQWMGLLFFSRFKVKVSKTTKKKYNLHLFLCHLAKGNSMANYKDYKLLFNFLKLKKKSQESLEWQNQVGDCWASSQQGFGSQQISYSSN